MVSGRNLTSLGKDSHFNIDKGYYTGFTGVTFDAGSRADNNATSFTVSTLMAF